MLKSTYLTLAFRHDLLVDTPLRWMQGIYENSHSPTCDREVITSSPEHTNDDKLSLRSRWDIVQKMNDEANFWLNGYVNKQNCRIWSEANPQVYVETPLHPEKLTVWCALWAGGILLQKR
ncbi:hypothetical protein TNCV_4682091 [Trichonephila clavipes]|nr:hypothetical protein TNCV_4682091 [Trichonephila clavipes]